MQRTARLILAAVLLSFVFLPVCTNASTIVTPPSTTTVTPANPVPVLAGENSANVGVVDALTQQDATHVFTLTNPTQNVLQLVAVRGSCGCEHLAYLVNGAEVPSTTVNPGSTVQVKVNVRLRGQPAEELAKTAWVIGPAGKILDTLTISFTVRQPYKVAPQHLDIGEVSVGGTKTAMTTVQVDAVLVPNGQFPAFVSDTVGVTAKQIGTPRNTTRDGKPTLSADYIVTVDRIVNMGPFAAMLSFPLKTPANTVDMVYLPVSGTVVGDFAATPRQINFGYVSAGTSPVRSLVLSGSTPDKLKLVKVISASQWVSGQIIDNGDSAVCTVNVTLSPKTPAGTLQTTVTLFTGPTQTFTVPVNATVVGQ